VGDLHVHWIMPEVVGLEVGDTSDRWYPHVGDRREKKEKMKRKRGRGEREGCCGGLAFAGPVRSRGLGLVGCLNPPFFLL
jgi:hypothetical protein